MKLVDYFEETSELKNSLFQIEIISNRQIF